VLDLSEAYLQIEVEQHTQKYLTSYQKYIKTISTHMGYFKPTRLMYGVASAPDIFQLVLENVLREFPNIRNYHYSVIRGAKSRQALLQKLDKVLAKFAELNIHINLDKCFFVLSEVEYLGHIIGKFGLKISPERVQPLKSTAIAEENDVHQLPPYASRIIVSATLWNDVSFLTRFLVPCAARAGLLARVSAVVN